MATDSHTLMEIGLEVSRGEIELDSLVASTPRTPRPPTANINNLSLFIVFDIWAQRNWRMEAQLHDGKAAVRWLGPDAKRYDLVAPTKSAIVHTG